MQRLKEAQPDTQPNPTDHSEYTAFSGEELVMSFAQRIVGVFVVLVFVLGTVGMSILLIPATQSFVSRTPVVPIVNSAAASRQGGITIQHVQDFGRRRAMSTDQAYSLYRLVDEEKGHTCYIVTTNEVVANPNIDCPK